MSLHFITFGNKGESQRKKRNKMIKVNYEKASIRLTEEIKRLKLFNNHTIYSDADLKKDKNFWKDHSNFISNSKRGYGYWLWKSYLIKKKIETLKDGDILLYLDAGCEMLYEKKDRLIELIEKVKDELLIASICGNSEIFLEKYWCKMDLIDHLNVNNEVILNSPQRQGGALLLYICPKIRDFINNWYSVCSSNNYHWIDDTKSKILNDSGFREHRHDQAVFSLLSKKNNLFGNSLIDYAVNISQKRN